MPFNNSIDYIINITWMEDFSLRLCHAGAKVI